MALKHSHDLLEVLVEHGGVLVRAPGHDLVRVRHADVQGEDPGHRGRVEAGVAVEKKVIYVFG